jgi:hypothetical protein
MLAGTGLHCEEPIERGLSWLFGGQNDDVNFSDNLSSPIPSNCKDSDFRLAYSIRTVRINCASDGRRIIQPMTGSFSKDKIDMDIEALLQRTPSDDSRKCLEHTYGQNRELWG